MNPKGVVIHPSPFPVKETIDRLVVFLQGHGVTIYARIDQQAEVRHAGQEIAPLEFILFGNPSVGGKLMAANPVAALDLPLKIIAWEEEGGKVFVGFNAAGYVGERYALPAGLTDALELGGVIGKVLG